MLVPYWLLQMEPTPDLRWLAGFMRQHTHDIRNDLTGLDLEAAVLAEMVKDPDSLDALSRIRSQIREISHHLRSLSARFEVSQPLRIAISAQELFWIFQDQAASQKGAGRIEWKDDLGGAALSVKVDPNAIADVAKELFANAYHYGAGEPLRITAQPAGGTAVFRFSQTQASRIEGVEKWGALPLPSTRRGGYGLGLWAIHRAVAANEGILTHQYDEEKKQLVSTLTFSAL